MEFDRMLAELFQEEDRAREMAHRLMDAAQASTDAALRERPSLLAFLHGAMERHMAHEEAAIFPALELRGLGPEVQVAIKQHGSLRRMTAELETARDDEVRRLIFEIARLMLHHTNFEGDYIYPELSHDEWRNLMRETVARSEPAPSG